MILIYVSITPLLGHYTRGLDVWCHSRTVRRNVGRLRPRSYVRCNCSRFLGYRVDIFGSLCSEFMLQHIAEYLVVRFSLCVTDSSHLILAVRWNLSRSGAMCQIAVNWDDLRISGYRSLHACSEVEIFHSLMNGERKRFRKSHVLSIVVWAVSHSTPVVVLNCFVFLRHFGPQCDSCLLGALVTGWGVFRSVGQYTTDSEDFYSPDVYLCVTLW